jgi:ligand-binding sensor domain-containing protein
MRFPWTALRSLLLVAWACVQLPAEAQQHAFKRLGPEDGLAQSQVRCMAQDAGGYLWFGTLGGASRYDGHGFENMALQEGLPDAHVSAMVRDAQGTFWLASGSTLMRQAGRRLLPERLPTGDAGARIMGLVALPDGRLFVGTDGDGLFVRDADGLRAVEGYPGDTAAHIRSLLALRDGRLLVGLRNGLLVGAEGRFSAVPLGDEEPKAVSALTKASDGA